jgi:hypothetical protein
MADHPGVITWWLESKCRLRPRLRCPLYLTEAGGGVGMPTEVGENRLLNMGHESTVEMLADVLVIVVFSSVMSSVH